MDKIKEICIIVLISQVCYCIVKIRRNLMEWFQFTMLIIALLAMHRDTSKSMKDFNGRLCTLEEKHNNNVERIVRQCLEARK